MNRKTVDVAYMKEYANQFLKGDDPALKDVRRGVMIATEEMLFRTGNYKGFRILDESDVTRIEYI